MTQRIWHTIRAGVSSWRGEQTRTFAAALTYYAVFTSIPLLILALMIAQRYLGTSNAESQLIDQLRTLVGGEAAQSIARLVRGAGAGYGTTIVSVLLLLYSASRLFSHLRTSLNRIWDVAGQVDYGLVGGLIKRAMAVGMVVLVLVLLLATLLLNTWVSAFGQQVTEILPWLSYPIVLRLLNAAISLMIFTLICAALFKTLPDVHISWNDVWVGAAITALLLTIAQLLIGVYLGQSQLVTPYGAAGALLVLLVWLYFSGQAFYLGAALTQVYARRFGTQIVADAQISPLEIDGATGRQGQSGHRRAPGAAPQRPALAAGGAGWSAGALLGFLLGLVAAAYHRRAG